MLKEILASLEGLTDLERAEVLRTLMSGQTVLQKVKVLLGITTEDQDDVLEYVIQTVQTLVLRYINWDELPLELENVLAVMCVSYYKAAGLGTTAAAPGAVSSVKRGDVQTSFAVGSGSSGSAGTFNLGNDNGDFFGWKTVLNEYRKLLSDNGRRSKAVTTSPPPAASVPRTTSSGRTVRSACPWRNRTGPGAVRPAPTTTARSRSKSRQTRSTPTM